jgi:hypothetical protein
MTTENLPVSWADKLAKYAVAAAAVEQTSEVQGSFLSTKSGVLAYKGTPLAGNKLTCIVVDHVLENHYYDVGFDPNNPRSPVCYAFGDKDEDMEPHEACESPQADKCSQCEMNKFPPRVNGKQPAKPCKNVRRLAIIAPTEMTPEGIANAEVAYLRVPVMSVKGWSAYVNGVGAQYKRPPFGMLTEVGVKPDQKAQFLVTFTSLGTIPLELMDACEARHLQQFDAIQFPYQKNSESAEEVSESREAKRSRVK